MAGAKLVKQAGNAREVLVRHVEGAEGIIAKRSKDASQSGGRASVSPKQRKAVMTQLPTSTALLLTAATVATADYGSSKLTTLTISALPQTAS